MMLAVLAKSYPAHRTGRADLPHPALGEDSRNRREQAVNPEAYVAGDRGHVRQ
jgi:hypothetical protein